MGDKSPKTPNKGTEAPVKVENPSAPVSSTPVSKNSPSYQEMLKFPPDGSIVPGNAPKNKPTDNQKIH